MRSGLIQPLATTRPIPPNPNTPPYERPFPPFPSWRDHELPLSLPSSYTCRLVLRSTMPPMYVDGQGNNYSPLHLDHNFIFLSCSFFGFWCLFVSGSYALHLFIHRHIIVPMSNPISICALPYILLHVASWPLITTLIPPHHAMPRLSLQCFPYWYLMFSMSCDHYAHTKPPVLPFRRSSSPQFYFIMFLMYLEYHRWLMYARLYVTLYMIQIPVWFSFLCAITKSKK